jgi:putative peptidoglycan lipid II flippase
VAAFGILSRLLGFVRELVLAATYGTNAKTDAYVAGLFVVNTVAAMLLYVLVTSVIPLFHGEERDHGESSAWRLVGVILTWVGLILIVVTGIVAIWPEGVSALFSFKPATASIAQELLRIMAPALMLQGISAVFTALLQLRGSFSRPAAIGVTFNAGIIVGIVALNPFIGIRGAAWGVVIGAIGQVALQLPEFTRFWKRGGGRLGFRHPRLGSALVLALPVFLATFAQQINSFTDKLFINAFDLDDGRIAALNFASALGSAPRTAILFPLLVPLFPHISRLLTEGKRDDAKRAFVRSAGLLALVAAPVTAFMAIQAQGLAQIAFERGKCRVDCRVEIGKPVVFYALAVWGAFMVYLLNRTLSAARKPREILAATLVTVCVVIALDLLLIERMEQAGLALASMAGVYVNTAIMLWFLHRELPDVSIGAFVSQQARVLASVLPPAGLVVLLEHVLPSEGRPFVQTLGLVGAKGAILFAGFAACASLFARDEVRSARDAARSVVSRRRPRAA